MTQPDPALLRASSWPATDLGNALRALVRKAGIGLEAKDTDSPEGLEGDLQPWLADMAARLGIEIVPVSNTCGALRDMLRRIGPSLLRLPGPDEARFLIVLGGGRFGLSVIEPGGSVRRLDPGLVESALLNPFLAAEQASVRPLIHDLGLTEEIGEAGLRAFVLERLGETPISGIWFLRPSPGSEATIQARTTRLPLLLSLLLLARGLGAALFLLLWWLVFRSNDAPLSTGLWVLCALSLVPLRLVDAWAQSRLSLDAGALLKESLLYGTLQLDRTAVRGRGAGQFLGMAMEGEVSSAAMESALLVLVALVEIVAGIVVVSVGAAGDALLPLLLGWLAFTGFLCWRYAKQAQRWIGSFQKVTHDLVERLVGYQTRLVQERVEDRHREEDTLLHDYLSMSQELDRRALWLDGLVSTGWLILGLAALEPALVSGKHDNASMAIALGGLLLSANALKQLVAGVVHLVEVAISWQQTAPIQEAGRKAFAEGMADRAPRAPRSKETPGDAPLLRFNDLSLRYSAKAPTALRQCSQQIQKGDRVLLEGPSGGGKSSLATVLAGLCAPDAGAIWLFDERREEMTPEQWRARVALVPQFHDNHILTESLLFNLLLGRHWPPTEADVKDAAAICDLLGLQPLVERMPQGLTQPVGDGGWSLSHGERSRVFLARALLQEQVELIILDESFAALDPETLRLACRGILSSSSAKALLVIAHP